MTAARHPALPAVDDVVRLSADIIGVDSLSADTNFFEAGGDSITAARLAVLLEEQWNVPVDVFAIMAAEDLREIHSSVVRSAVTTGTPRQPSPGGRTPSLNQRIRLDMDAEAIGRSGHRPAHTLAVAFRAGTDLDPDRLRRALQAVATRHEPLRSVFPASDRAVVLEDPEPGLTAQDIAECDDRALWPMLTAHAGTVFDLAAAPPWSVLVLRHGAHCTIVSLLFDHLVLDGDSMAILLADLESAYDQDGSLPSLPTSYYDWADRQRAEQLPVALEAAAPLARPEHPGGGVLPLLLLTAEEDLGPAGLGQLRRRVAAVPVTGLERRAAARGATLFQALIAYWSAAVDQIRVPGPNGIVLPVANRTAETRAMVGWVANMAYLPLPADPGTDENSRLAAVRAGFAGLGATSTVPLRTVQEYFWRGEEPLYRFPGLLTDFRRESAGDRTAWHGRWHRVDVEPPAFLLPGLSLWPRQRVDGTLDLTLAYDTGRLRSTVADGLLESLEGRIREALTRGSR